VVYRKSENLRTICDHCRLDEQGGLFRQTNVAPVRAMVDRGVALQLGKWGKRATMSEPGGAMGFSCPNCQSPFYESHLEWLQDPDEPVTSTAVLEPQLMQAHWCVPDQKLFNGATVIAFVLGTNFRSERGEDTRTSADLILEARTREQLRKRRRQQEPVLFQPRPSPRPSTAEPSLSSVASIRNESMQRWEPTTPPPPWDGETPSNPHERTHALDIYTTTHVRYVDELLEIFPPMAGECVCVKCRAIHDEFPRNQRKQLWPGRERGRIDWVKQALSPGAPSDEDDPAK
jgi:hypothetical protein